MKKRPQKKHFHTIEILMPSEDAEEKDSFTFISPYKKSKSILKSTESFESEKLGRGYRRRHNAVREQIPDFFKSNTYMPMNEELEKVMFIPEEHTPDETQHISSILKNHFIFFCLRKMKGKPQKSNS